MEPLPADIWEQLAARKAPDLKRKIVLHYAGLVQFVLKRFGYAGRARSLGLERDDLVQMGMMGLLDAAERFSPALGVKFDTYAVSRIRGMMLDEMRRLDWVPRAVHAQHRAYRDAQDQVVRETGREASAGDIAAKLSMTAEEFRKFISETGEMMNGQTRRSGVPAEGETVETVASDSLSPEEQLSTDDVKRHLMDAINKLPPRERAVIALYYYEGLKFAEIGAVLRVSESRISQVHTEILAKLRLGLAGMEENL
jgi:RNA polymerase sigma factor for flagellar operon FliA